MSEAVSVGGKRRLQGQDCLKSLENTQSHTHPTKKKKKKKKEKEEEVAEVNLWIDYDTAHNIGKNEKVHSSHVPAINL